MGWDDGVFCFESCWNVMNGVLVESCQVIPCHGIVQSWGTV